MVCTVVAVVAVIIAVLGLATFVWAPRWSSAKLKCFDTSAHMWASLVTAGAILLAGMLYLIERQWSPRFEVEAQASTRPADSHSKAAIVQVDVSITNESRTKQTIGGYQIGSVGIRSAVNSAPDGNGDLPGQEIQTFMQTKRKKISAGETDHAYAELLVPCTWKLVRIVVKVPLPPHTIDAPPGNRWVYERKLLVSLEDACSAPPATNVKIEGKI